MGLPPYIAFTADDERVTVGGVSSTAHVITTCIPLTLEQDEMPAGKDLVVYGDDVTIASALSLYGQNMTIIARSVTLASGASVDLSGPAGVPLGTDKAPDGNPGASTASPDATDGLPGTAGTPGFNAGSFTLMAGTVTGTMAVTCTGGAGARGQDGGNGGNGMDGANGAPFEEVETQGGFNVVYSLLSDGQPGANGGRAGAGGTGGQGGAGGRGGTVTIGFGVAPPPDVVTATCGGGAGGDAGNAGSTGTAGSGGTGGSLAAPEFQSGKGSSSSGYQDSGNFAPNGTPGVVPPPSAGGAPGATGTAGSATPAVVIAPDFYGTYSPSTQQELLALRQAEFLYLDGEAAGGSYESAAQLLLWLSAITAPPAGVTPDPGRAQTHARANALLAQISQKLNFYGQPAGHVPLASLGYYQTVLPGELAAGVTTETSYNDYVSQAGQQQAQIATLQALLTQSATQLAALQATRQPLADQITQYQAAVAELQLARNLQGVVLAEAEQQWEAQVIAELRQAVSDAGCKTFTDIFATVGNVVTVDSDALTAMKDRFDLGEATLGGLQQIGTDVADWENAVDQLETAEGDLGSIVAAANTLAGDAASGDSGKIAVDRATFDAMLVPFQSLDGTGELEAQINLYLAKAQAFGQKQLDYNALQVQLANLDARIAQKQAVHDQIQNQLSDSADPELPIYKAFAARTYGETLDGLIRDVYGLYQSFRYWALNDDAFAPGDGDWTMVSLSSIQAGLDQKVTAILNDFEGGTDTTTQTFDYRAADGPGWVISDARALQAFKSTGSIDFTILMDDPWVARNFAGFAQVVATDFTVKVHGAALTSHQLFVRLTHSGQAPFLDRAGKPWLFSHMPVSTSYKYDIGTGGRVAGGSLAGADNVQIGLSPFTTWNLKATAADNPGLVLKGVDQIVLKFAGRYLQTNSAAAVVRTDSPAAAVVRTDSPAATMVRRPFYVLVIQWLQNRAARIRSRLGNRA